MTVVHDRSDHHWMEQALALAALGEGTTTPNPLVGCLLVRDGEVVGQGVHRAAGRPHAEAQAVEEAGTRARGATLYVNLEPCAHHGRTPPCVEPIVRSGVRRVVASVEDPDPRVRGRGFRRLREAGVVVDVGPLCASARRLNAPFFHWHSTGRPLVTLKAACTLDGMISARDGRSRWISTAVSRRFARRLRFVHGGVLVGAGTIRRDDPRLSVRLPGLAEGPIRVVLAPGLDIDPGSRVFASGVPRTRVYASRDVPSSKSSDLERRADVVRVSAPGGALDLDEVLADLGRLGLRSILVEGGGKTLAGFLDAGIAARVVLVLAPALFGARGGTPLVDRDSVIEPARGWRLERVRRIPMGEDLVVEGWLRGAGSARIAEGPDTVSRS